MSRSVYGIVTTFLSVLVLLAPQATARAASVPVRFVDAAEAAEMIGSASVLDTRAFGAYLKGHIAGAVHLNDEALRAPAGGLPVQYLSPAQLAQIFGDAGVSLDQPVVVYSSPDDPLAATMTAYALTQIGHDQVRIINGGFEAWAANHPTTREFPTIERTTITPRDATLAKIAYADFAETIGFNDHAFIDARPEGQYLGDVPIWIRNGHIPGAHSLDWTLLTDPLNKHRLKPIEEIEAMLSNLGVSDRDDIIIYCGTGREATLMMLAISCELGWSKVRLYEGSWTEYSSIEGSKVEVGPRVEPKTRVHREGKLLISAQPTEETLDWLAAEGVKTVINLRTNRENRNNGFDEQELISDLGMDFVHIPMGGEDDYTPEQVRQFAAAFREAQSKGDVLVHCSSGGRARLIWMAYLIEELGLEPEEAIARANKLGGRPWELDRLLGGSLSITMQR
jgi:thiosulfate/3-mercaptopyruvate sulfurtransferase